MRSRLSPPDLEIIGCTVVDLIFPRVATLPTWPEHTEFTPSNLQILKTPPIVTLGGNGANCAYVAAKAGIRVRLHTHIGQDACGHLAQQWLESAGCQLASPSRGSTAVNVTAANKRFQRASFFYPGEMIGLPKPSTSGPRYTLICGWPHPPLTAMAGHFAAAHATGVKTVLDAGPILKRPWTLRSLRPVLKELDLFLCNERELKQITQANSLPSALALMRRSFAGDLVVKRGSQGALWLGRDRLEAKAYPRKPVRVLNTVGAGDSFNGALLAALVQGRAFSLAMKAAIQTSASVVASGRGVIGAKFFR